MFWRGRDIFAETLKLVGLVSRVGRILGKLKHLLENGHLEAFGKSKHCQQRTVLVISNILEGQDIFEKQMEQM